MPSSLNGDKEIWKEPDLQIEAYKDMITPVVDAFKYLTQVPFAFDVFARWFYLLMYMLLIR